ncbi:MAG: hypothetical protein ABF904_08245 [Ethanoligenens sp.]
MADREPRNEQDFLRMQQEAIRRVRDMQARARRTLEDAGVPLEPPAPQETQGEPTQSREAFPAFAEDTPSFSADEEPPEAAESPASANHAPETPFHFALDSEQIMLMLIIYLLYKDHGDQYLMMALAYLLLT